MPTITLWAPANLGPKVISNTPSGTVYVLGAESREIVADVQDQQFLRNVGLLAGAGHPDAPADGQQYVRQDYDWAEMGAMGGIGGVGPTGPTGPAGAVGPAGPQGAQGPAGPSGADSIVPGPTGPVGPQGSAGAQGPAGVIGPTGPQGTAGTPGTAGAIGPTGATGAQGSAGVAGPTGPQGLIGPTGPAGAAGSVGPAGPTGPMPPASIINPTMDGTATPGISTNYTREDHVHPHDTSLLALTGGTLTGALTLAPAAAPANLTLNIPADGYRNIMGQRAGLNRWNINIGNNISESGSNVGSDFSINRYNDAGAFVDMPVLINRASGAVTMTPGLLTLGSPTQAANVAMTVQAVAGQTRAINFYTGSSIRWAFVGANLTAESGGNAGSDLVINRYSDAGTIIDSPLTITRASGAVTLTGALTIPSPLTINGAAATQRNIFGQTTGSTRWAVFLGNNVAESGGNVGSDFVIQRFSDAGAVIDAPLIITRSSGAVAVKGSATNDNAAAGIVGEFISGGQAVAQSLTTATPLNLVTLNLTPGDWDVWGQIIYTPSAAPTSITAAIGTTSATLPTVAQLCAGNGAMTQLRVTYTSAQTQTIQTGMTRVSISATTPVYLLAQATFASGTCTAQGFISARRAR